MRNIWLFDVLILSQYGLICNCATRSDGCPEYSLLEPCSCIHRPGADILFCAGLKNLSVLDQVLERSPDWTFDTLFVCQSNLQNIPSNPLVQRQVKSVLVASSNMTSLFDKEADAAGNSVETLHINDVRFENGIPWNMIRSLRALRYFNLQFGDVPVIGSEVAKSFAVGLRHLRMSNTRTKEIDYGAFANLVELTEIKIRHSEVAVLERGVFPKPAKLTLIDFTSNQIESLPEDIFSDMPDLKYVYFGENKISQLSSALLGYAIDNFDFLILNGNPLNCDCVFKVLVEKDNQTVDGNCIFPDDKKGLLLANLTTEHFSTCS